MAYPTFRMFVVCCLAGIGLWFIPEDMALALRTTVRGALAPGQAAVRTAWHQGAEFVGSWGTFRDRSAEVRDLEEHIRSVELQNRQLQLAAARLAEQLREERQLPSAPPVAQPSAPLMSPQLVAARVLGDETAALWRSRKLLDTGRTAGVVESALVLDSARPLIDQGANGRLSPGDAVYAGQIVVGKIADVGRVTSTLRLVTDPAYTGRARIARKTSRGLVLGAEGTIVGDGSELCLVKHITDPVNVGDEVFTGGTDGVLPFPMYYGTVVRAELPQGAREWLIEVKPAATNLRLETVQVLQMTLNGGHVLAQ